MIDVRYTLLGDGPSDCVLMQVIDWALREEGVLIRDRAWADLSLVEDKPQGLAARVDAAIDLYPCDILFVHRDAENQPREVRQAEIQTACGGKAVRTIAVVPVRMTEAWLLHDECAIRTAAGNPGGTAPLRLPVLKRLEGLPDPKKTLFEALLAATESSGRRRKQKSSERGRMRTRVAELIASFSPLEVLPSFAAFRQDLSTALRALRR